MEEDRKTAKTMTSFCLGVLHLNIVQLLFIYVMSHSSFLEMEKIYIVVIFMPVLAYDAHYIDTTHTFYVMAAVLLRSKPFLYD